MPNELTGVKELSLKLSKLQGNLGIKALRSAAFKATTPVVREMKARAPKGTKAHRSYKGRYLAPGYTKRKGIRRITKKDRGKVTVAIGVRAEAFYAVTFLDEGTITVSQRRRKSGTKGTVRRVVGGMSRSVTPVKPYKIIGRNWFKSTFRRNKSRMLSAFREMLDQEVKKAAKKNG